MVVMLALLSQLAQTIGLMSVMNRFRNRLSMIKREGNAISGDLHVLCGHTRTWVESNTMTSLP